MMIRLELTGKPEGGRSEDFQRAAQLVRAAGGIETEVHLVALEGEPVPKARARFTSKGHAYTPAKTVHGENRIAAALRGRVNHTGNVAVACVFYRSTLHRVDVDNLLKAVLDGATKARVWVDDSQVTAILGVLEHDAQNPRTIIALAPHVSSMLRGSAAEIECERCGTRFTPGGERRAKARFCSRECSRTCHPRPCERCGETFTPKAANQRFCTTDCRLGNLHDATRTHGPKPTCEKCGNALSRRGYKQCRSCFEGRAVA